jgi:hypothetical protein
MNNKILLDNSGEIKKSQQENELSKPTVKANLFNSNTDRNVDTSKFPSWDILPPGQFINPRVKK